MAIGGVKGSASAAQGVRGAGQPVMPMVRAAERRTLTHSDELEGIPPFPKGPCT